MELRLLRLVIFLLLLIHSTKSDGNESLESYANLMKSYMNLSVAPCDDFYEYACGNFHQQGQEFDTELDRNTDHLVGKTEHLLGMVDLAESLNVSTELRVAQRFYNACLQADLYPFPAADPHYLEVIRSIGGFPAVDGASWNISNFSWFSMSVHMTNYGVDGLIAERIHPGYPYPPYLDFQRTFLGINHFISTYGIENKRSTGYKPNKKVMRRYLRAFKLPEDKIAEVIDGVFAFWLEALEVNSDEKKAGNCEIFEPNYMKIVWNQNTTKEVCNEYFEEMDKVCARHPEAVANYLAMKLLYAFDPKLQDSNQQRDYCDKTLRSSMVFLLNKLYLAEHFNDKTKLEVLKIEENVRTSLRISLQEADWLNAGDRNVELLRDPPIDLSWENFLDRLVSEIGRLEIVDESYAKTNINIQRLIVEINRYTSRHSNELPKSCKLPESVLFDIHRIVLLLEPPVYESSSPFSLKFAVLGRLLAGYSFKNNFVNIDYDDDGMMAYDKRVQCVLDYSNGTVSHENKWLYEHTIITMRLVFSAYQSHLKNILKDSEHEKINETIPGLDLSPNELFFLRYIQGLCSRPNDLARLLVVASFATNENVYQAFNCPVGSKMRPTAKLCDLG